MHCRAVLQACPSCGIYSGDRAAGAAPAAATCPSTASAAFRKPKKCRLRASFSSRGIWGDSVSLRARRAERLHIPRAEHGRINRKQRDISEIITKFPKGKGQAGGAGGGVQKPPSPGEVAAAKIEEAANGAVLFKKIFKLGDREVLAVATNADGTIRVTVVTNLKDPIVVHWSLSQTKPREWKKPPDDVLPAGSEFIKDAINTPCEKGFNGDTSLQFVELDLGKKAFHGMPFVLRSGGNWIKANDSDFYVPLQAESGGKVKLDASGTAKNLLDDIASREPDAERSLMHRYNIGADLLQASKDGGELVIAAFLVWLRYMAMRQLTWNKNYNVKPREISSAQDRLTNLLQAMYLEQPQYRELIRLTLSTVGRGAQGDVGQRIRDEILVIQRNNDCKGGFMEEWHQKLHNNTSPDDVIICQAIMDYLRSGFKMDVYWKTLNSNGVTKQRMQSYDRPIHSEPQLRPDQKDGLLRDLTNYMRSLKAVHSGADLESAISTCMGYSAEGHDFMGTIQMHPIHGLSGALPDLLKFVMSHVEDKNVLPLVEGLLECRRELYQTLQKPHDRLKDIIFLDLGLDSTVRTAVERGLEGFSKASPPEMIDLIALVLENMCLSTSNNEEAVFCLKEWYHILNLCRSGADNWALQAKSVLDRTRLVLGDKVEYYERVLQPTARYLGNSLGVEKSAIDIFTEEMIRAGSAASLSILLNRLDPVLRKMANLGSWQVISPVNVKGYVSVVQELGDVQDKVYERPTVLVSGRVKGEEEIPDGAVAVLTPDMPDVLSHVSVRARNCKVLFATCFDPKILEDLRALNGKPVKLQLTPNSEVTFAKINDAEMTSKDAGKAAEAEAPHIVLKTKKFMGKYAVPMEEFSTDLVGAKSLNTAKIRGKLPSWIKLPTSVALPFGCFEEVLAEDINKSVASEIAQLKKKLTGGDLSILKEIRETVLKLKAPQKLIDELKKTMLASKMPWPGNEGEQRWEQAWLAIKKVWASKWNERAYISTRKAKIDHENLRMAVLVQEIVRADYAFVIHTINPSNGNATEIYAEVVKGLGETLVGAFQGRALSFVTPKTNLKAPKILGYPSKRIGLYIKASTIFRSDSNGEDLEGYAGAGLYDSVPMDKEEEVIVDYSTDKLLLDKNFQKTILSNIAAAGAEIEKIYGTAQDVEGCIKDGEVYVVQTRPQM